MNSDAKTIPDMNEFSGTTHEIYRYKFSTDFMKILLQFAKIHQYDDRHTFKEAWKIWIEENSDDVESEIRTLNTTGYTGDIIDKMYKSARYYFRKKDTSAKEAKKRRVYISLNKEFLNVMNMHVQKFCVDEKNTPAEGYEEFCQTHKAELSDEVTHIFKAGIIDAKDISAKLKKTYKNKYFQLTHT